MKKLFFLIAFLFVTALSFAQQQVYVSGYTRSNGTYVQGYIRTAPSYTKTYSTQTYTNTYSTPTYSTPIYANTYSTPTYSTPSYSTPSYSSQTIYTGPRGGTYYINSNGNKTYVR